MDKKNNIVILFSYYSEINLNNKYFCSKNQLNNNIHLSKVLYNSYYIIIIYIYICLTKIQQS